MMRKTAFLVLSIALFLAVSCSGNKESAASMEQLHARNGQPVSVRKLQTEDFSVYLKYPALIQASSESTAYAGLNDVVRTISARVGAAVKQGDIIVSFSADNQVLQQATLAHENARGAYNRTSALFRSNDVSRQDYDTVRMQYEISATNLKAANDMVYVKAPISGTLTQLNVRVTENVRPGAPLFTVSNSNAFEARLYVGVDEIEKIQAGARAFIDLARGKQEGQTIEGRITQVSLIMDSQRQSFPVTVIFDGTNRRLVSGMNVDISVETYRNEKAIVLARRELVQTETGPAVFVIDDDAASMQKARRVAVQTGEEKGLRVEIVGGLSEGDIIVSEGVNQINEETRLNIVPAVLPEF
ncbi:MAG: efflux RND transporter periplasmic adaptor subunit [Treponema sp.]|jgi:RND family efflux transporter MFP subunit|nr:efflux RND transporter periplasmic adaptor subunit [Treponema sp.]